MILVNQHAWESIKFLLMYQGLERYAELKFSKEKS